MSRHRFAARSLFLRNAGALSGKTLERPRTCAAVVERRNAPWAAHERWSAGARQGCAAHGGAVMNLFSVAAGVNTLYGLIAILAVTAGHFFVKIHNARSKSTDTDGVELE